MLRVAAGIMVHNEEHNLASLLGSLLESPPVQCALDAVFVVLSGCTDRSVEIARTWAARHPSIELIVEPERRGKSAAVARFVKEAPSDVDALLLISGDVLPAPGAIDALVAPLADPAIGMTGARPVPTNPESGLVHRVVHCQWDLHDRVARQQPKLGEMVAFQRNVPPPPNESAVDEASLEWNVLRSGRRLAYVPEAVVYNRGPGNFADFLAQRRRIQAGHLWLRRQTGYSVSTRGSSTLLRAVSDRLRSRPGDAGVLVLAGLLEASACLLGSLDLVVLGRNPRAWAPLPSTKHSLTVPNA